MRAAEELANVLTERMDVLNAAAQDVVAKNESTIWTGETLDQALHAFRAVLLEDLRGEGTEARDLMLETAIPAAAAQGQTLEELVGSVASFAALLGASVPPLLPEEHRGEAAAWLADFFGRWATDVAAVYRRAEAGS